MLGTNHSEIQALIDVSARLGRDNSNLILAL